MRIDLWKLWNWPHFPQHGFDLIFSWHFLPSQLTWQAEILRQVFLFYSKAVLSSTPNWCSITICNHCCDFQVRILLTSWARTSLTLVENKTSMFSGSKRLDSTWGMSTSTALGVQLWSFCDSRSLCQWALSVSLFGGVRCLNRTVPKMQV